MRSIFTLFAAVIFSASLYSQPLVQVSDINDATPAMLANCNDTSSYFGDTVTVVGYVVTSGNLSEVASSSINGANGARPFIWINDTANGGAVGPRTGLEVMGVNWQTNQATANFTTLISGDLVEITGVVGGFASATQFQPLNDNSLTIEPSNFPTFTPAQVDIADLNDQNQVNKLTTGEQWEGVFIEVNNVTVTNVNQFGSGVSARVELTVADSAGNSMQVYDFFLAQHLPSWTTINPNSPATNGSFTPPSVGTFYNSLKGVVEHSGNGCTGGTGQGYRIHPFDPSHYDVGKALPAISNVTISPNVPSSTDPIVVSADVIDADGSIDSVHIFWTNDTTDPISAYSKAPMVLTTGNTYSYTIPAQANNTNIAYYIRAVDNDTSISLYPQSSSVQNPNVAFIFVRDGGLTIMDIQTPSTGGSGDSPFDGQTVTVSGVVTAAERDCDLGFVYLQDTAATEYAGIGLRGSLDLANLYRNEFVEVTGTVQESFGYTQLLVSNITSTGIRAEVEPVELDPGSTSQASDLEKYESMLITYRNPAPGGKVYVVNPKLDNFGEYAISSNPNATNPDEYRRVLAGRKTGNTSAQSSLYVQLVTEARWDSIDGNMFYPPIVTSDTMTMDAMTGILWYAFGNFKLTPRNNHDIEGLNVDLDTTGCITPSFSIKELRGKKLVEVYPNPASNHVNVAVADEVATTATVFNIEGKMVASATSGRGETITIDVSALAPGLYILKVSGSTNSDYGSFKIIVTK